MKFISGEDVKKELLKDPLVKKHYDALGPQYAVISKLIEARIKYGLTQAQLAQRIGIKQSAIARLESGTHNATIGFLEKVAKALDARLAITIT